MFNYEYFIIFFKNFLKISIDAHCFHKPESKSKIQFTSCLFCSYNYNHFVNITLQIILPRTISKYC